MALGRWFAVGVALVTCLVAVVSADAAERIRFKNGHTLDVAHSREVGDTLVLKLLDGSELTIPKNLVEKVEGGKDLADSAGPTTNWSGRGPSLTDLDGYKRLLAQSGKPRPLGGAVLNAQTANGPHNFGFSSNGSGDLAEQHKGSGPPIRVTDPRSMKRPGSAATSLERASGSATPILAQERVGAGHRAPAGAATSQVRLRPEVGGR